jgi:DNA-binding transcriptional regulator GbsR (MarR family)
MEIFQILYPSWDTAIAMATSCVNSLVASASSTADVSVMTEFTDTQLVLTPAMQRFVLHWGDMGTTWGVNRSIAQIHALLFVSDRPLNAEEIADALKMARSNVSNSIRDLMDWGLVRRKPMMGDRRDHYEAEGDVWVMATRIVAIRKAREIDPAAEDLRMVLDEARADPATAAAAVRRLAELKGLMDLLNDWYEQMNRVPKSQLLPLIKLGSKAVEMLAFATGKSEKSETKAMR